MAGKPSPIELQKFLAGVNYPASRDDLVSAAERNGAGDDALRYLRDLPDRTFDGPDTVSKEFSRET
ncbi:DUF2795 domain-containing protein [Amycolatopsis taiwanensis]|uniref:DUF2795 domain-containing protein n=1 Tax=Amycolatopsis taiwanensis TaxID=342230 RepID=A0A9W6R734_9PSEU|nr:DUF2795 domain-containing protein [Amycolatopsis taiwanensis]GLY68807.1 hypothetical protein Atai01_54260 [Amycolatopsis taiwanensis]